MAKIRIPKDDLIKLYYNQKKSKYEIGRIYCCSFTTVLNRMRDYEMKPLSRSIIQSKYPKKDFNGKLSDKAYMIGFRLGDLNVYQTVAHSDVIVVRCHTTKKEQLDLIRDLFSNFGKVTIGGKKSYYINCFLNKSFDFLLPKEDRVEEWITNNAKYSNCFAAGYIDAEGNIGIYDGRARFKIDSYDKNIIFWLYDWMLSNGIICPRPIMIGKKGQIYEKKKGYKYNQDLWRIRVSEKKSLEKMFLVIKSFLRHKTRLNHLIKCQNNLDARRTNQN